MYQRVGELTAFERETRARLERAIEDLEQTPEDQTLLREEVVSDDVARVVERWTGIPVQKLLDAKDVSQAPPMAPAYGLYLSDVRYMDDYQTRPSYERAPST